jgi:hypothetical protein
MPQGLITSLLIKLTIEFWYLTLAAILLKLFFLRLTATETMFRAVAVMLVGSATFFTVACLAGLIFSALSYVSTGFIMFGLAFASELLFCTIMFRIETRKLVPPFVIGNGIYITTLYLGAVSLGFL